MRRVLGASICLVFVAMSCSGGDEALGRQPFKDAGHDTHPPDAASDTKPTYEAGVDAADAPGDAPGDASDAGGCGSPTEICDLADNDGNGACDDVLGCRTAVVRSFAAGAGQHFYTTSTGEASCCGYSIEQYGAFYLYAAALPGLTALYRCSTSDGKHLYTTDAGCEGATNEGVMGYVATSEMCGAVALYRLKNPANGDHLYTTSSVEVTSAENAGYVSEGTSGYVWPSDCGGANCTWPSPVAMNGSTLSRVTGFPTTWYGFPIPSCAHTFSALSGSLSIANSQSLYSEVLFILEYLPAGNPAGCFSGLVPDSAGYGEFGPPGAAGVANFIVKAPTQASVSLPINLSLPGGPAISNCLIIGLNGGPVSTPQDVLVSANLELSYSEATSSQSVYGVGGEFCFGQNWGCQAATTDNTKSFATVTPINQAGELVALYGDVSDTTFDGTNAFGAPPAGPWTATNDFYVYHGAECSAFGVASGPVGPGDYYAQIPADATHLLSVPMSGSGIGVAQAEVYQPFSNVSLAAGDCFVTLWGMQSGGGFDNETQVLALVK